MKKKRHGCENSKMDNEKIIIICDSNFVEERAGEEYLDSFGYIKLDNTNRENEKNTTIYDSNFVEESSGDEYTDSFGDIKLDNTNRKNENTTMYDSNCVEESSGEEYSDVEINYNELNNTYAYEELCPININLDSNASIDSNWIEKSESW